MQPTQPQQRKPKSPGTSPSASSEHPDVKLLLVNAPNEQTVKQHPEIAPRLATGWKIRSATPRIVENDGPKWLVVLERVPRSEAAFLPSVDALPARARREERVRKRLETAGEHDVLKRPPSAQEH